VPCDDEWPSEDRDTEKEASRCIRDNSRSPDDRESEFVFERDRECPEMEASELAAVAAVPPLEASECITRKCFLTAA
jgi:hypothetical protein